MRRPVHNAVIRPSVGPGPPPPPDPQTYSNPQQRCWRLRSESAKGPAIRRQSIPHLCVLKPLGMEWDAETCQAGFFFLKALNTCAIFHRWISTNFWALTPIYVQSKCSAPPPPPPGPEIKLRTVKAPYRSGMDRRR